MKLCKFGRKNEAALVHSHGGFRSHSEFTMTSSFVEKMTQLQLHSHGDRDPTCAVEIARAWTTLKGNIAVLINRFDRNFARVVAVQLIAIYYKFLRNSCLCDFLKLSVNNCKKTWFMTQCKGHHCYKTAEITFLCQKVLCAFCTLLASPVYKKVTAPCDIEKWSVL